MSSSGSKIRIPRSGKILRRILPVVLLPALLQSCFTGIESTPKISYKDVRREQITVSDEERLASRISAPTFADWTPGNLFLVTDAKADLTYLPMHPDARDVSTGDILCYQGVRSVPSIVGGTTAELIFTRPSVPGDSLLYRPQANEQTLRERTSFHAPFLVDMQAVAAADTLLRGRQLYTRTDRWLTSDGKDIHGRKFLKVRIDSLLPGDENYCFRVFFTSLEKDGERGTLPMAATVDDDTPQLRGFASLFLLNDPRADYPQITDANWELIRRGRVTAGMTMQEARLALGAPKEVDRTHDRSLIYERWGYPSGIYLIFEDGLLTRFKQ